MIYFTKAMDTPESIAAYFNGGAAADLAKQIKAINQPAMANQLYEGSQYYAPNRAIWMPAGENFSKMEIHDMLRRFDQLSPAARTNMIALQRQGFDIMSMAHAQSLAAYAQVRTAKDHGAEALGGLLMNAQVQDVAYGAAHFKADRLGLFEKAIDDVKDHLMHFKNAVESKVTDDIKLAQSKLKHAYELMHAKFDAEMKQFHIEREAVYHKFRTLEKKALKEGVKVLDSREVKMALRIGKCLEHVAHGVFIAQIAEGAYKAYEDYKRHKPWLKEAIETGLKAAATVAISVVIAAVFVSGGWVVVAGAAIADAAFNYGADKLIDYTVRRV